jgi:hypothetical protein
MTAEPFAAGWCRVRVRDGVAVLWCEPFPCDAPHPWIIASRTREACASVQSAAFIMRADEFLRDALVERIAVQQQGAEA